MTELFFVRHCEPERLSRGDDNFSRRLTEKGLADTAHVTEYLEKQDITAVVSSPYLRAVQTISPFAEKYGFRIEKAFDLSERRLDIVLDSEHFMPFIRHQWADFDYREADGECLREVQRRCIRAVEDIIDRYPLGHIAIGSHGTALCTIINYYCPDFGFTQFMELVDIMPFIAHLSFYGRQCESIEFIDPLPFVPPEPHKRNNELVLAPPSESRRDYIDFRDFCGEFVYHGEKLSGCMYLDRFESFAEWERWKDSDPQRSAARVWFARRKTDSRLIGVMTFDISRHDSGGFISDVTVSVRQSERWNGYGAELFQIAKEYSISQGIDKLLIVCDSGNMPARRAIESAGGLPLNMLPAPKELYESGLARRYSL